MVRDTEEPPARAQRARTPAPDTASVPGLRGGQMPLYRRLPKRGFKNPMRRVIAIVNIEQLKRFQQGSIVNRDTLTAIGLVSGAVDGIKVLGNGEINFALSVNVDQVSRGARAKIEAAGGTIVEVI